MKRKHNRSKASILVELKALKIKNKSNEARIASLEEKLEKASIALQTVKTASPEIAIDNYESYFKYKYNSLKSTAVWSTAGRVFTYSRRSLLVARLLRYASIIIAFVETSAVFLLFSTILLIALPATLLIGLILIVVDAVSGKKNKDKVLSAVNDKKILILIAHKGYRKNRSTYFDSMVREYAKDGRYCVIVVSKSLIDGPFLTAKFQSKNLIIIRESYFFRLKRAINKAELYKEKVIIVY